MFVLAKLVNSVYKQSPSLYCHSFFTQLTRYCLWNRSTNSLEKNGQITKSNGMPSLILEPMLITMLRLRVFSLDWSCLIISNIIFLEDIFVQIVLTLISHLCIHITKFWTWQLLNLQCGVFLSSRLNHVKPSHLYWICTLPLPSNSIIRVILIENSWLFYHIKKWFYVLNYLSIYSIHM
jgi:hypothetical protein